MEGHTAEAPLKVCRHCSVASRTDADDCPSCGKPYARRWPWRPTLAILIIVAAFGVGFGVRKLLDDDPGQGVITAEEGTAIERGISQADLTDELGEASQQTRVGRGPTAQTCLFYEIEDEPGKAWEFCFLDDELVTSQAIPLRG
jgi:hypothetical protein